MLKLLTCIFLLLNASFSPAQFAGVGPRLLSPPIPKARYTGINCSTGLAGGAGQPLTCPVTLPTAGGTILFQAAEFNYGGTPVITDDNTGTISHILGPTVFNGNGQDDLWVISNAGAGLHTLTITYSSGLSYPGINILVFSGASTTSPVDVALAVNTTNECSHVTTTAAADLLVSFVSISGAVVVPATTPQRMVLVNIGGIVSYGTARYAGDNYTAWTGGGGQNFACDTVALH